MPVVTIGNPFVPGDAQASPNVYIRFYRIDTVPTAGYPYIRYPASGWEGTAYTLYGVEREKVEFVDINEMNESNAAAKLALLKNVIISGDVAIEGDPIPELINLQKRINIQHDVNVTGIETLGAIFNSYQPTK